MFFILFDFTISRYLRFHGLFDFTVFHAITVHGCHKRIFRLEIRSGLKDNKFTGGVIEAPIMDHALIRYYCATADLSFSVPRAYA